MINKFRTIEDSSQLIFPEIENGSTKYKDICLVYCLWSRAEYLQFLYYALYSQYRFTDARNIDIYLFIQSDIYDQAISMFSQSGITIVKMKDVFNKYSITSHEKLEKYKKIVISDCDTFLFGKKHNLYEELLKYDSSILMMRDQDIDTMRVLLSRSQLSYYKEKSLYFNIMSGFLDQTEQDLMKMVKSHQWFLSCFMFFNAELYRGEKWKAYYEQFLAISSWCDETVFLTYSWINDYKIEDFDVINNVETVLSSEMDMVETNKDKLLITHPLHGDYCHNKKIIQYYESIVDFKL